MPVIEIIRPAPTNLNDTMSEICYIDMITNRHVIKYTPLEVIFSSKNNGVQNLFIYRGTRAQMRLIYDVASALFDLEVEEALGRLPPKSPMVILALEQVTGTQRRVGPGFGHQNQLISLAIVGYEQQNNAVH